MNRGKEMIFTTSDNVDLWYKISGRGKTLLFLHGGPGGWSKSFEELGGKNFEDSFRMIYLDQRGCGRSDFPHDNNYSLDRVVKDIEELREYLGIKDLNVIAHSFGGILLINYLYRYPKNVNKAIFLNSTLSIRRSLNVQVRKTLEILDVNYKEIFEQEDDLVIKLFKSISKLSSEGKHHELLGCSKEDYDRLNSVEKHLKIGKGQNFMKYVFKDYEYMKDHYYLSSKIDIPVLLLVGNKDYSIGPNHYFGEKFVNKIYKKIPGGHLLYYEKNNEFKKMLVDFLY
jgi:proline iminopeptidase